MFSSFVARSSSFLYLAITFILLATLMSRLPCTFCSDDCFFILLMRVVASLVSFSRSRPGSFSSLDCSVTLALPLILTASTFVKLWKMMLALSAADVIRAHRVFVSFSRIACSILNFLSSTCLSISSCNNSVSLFLIFISFAALPSSACSVSSLCTCWIFASSNSA